MVHFLMEIIIALLGNMDIVIGEVVHAFVKLDMLESIALNVRVHIIAKEIFAIRKSCAKPTVVVQARAISTMVLATAYLIELVKLAVLLNAASTTNFVNHAQTSSA